MARRTLRRSSGRTGRGRSTSRRSYGRRGTYTARARGRPSRRGSRRASGRQGRIVIEVVQQQPVRAGQMVDIGTVATRAPRLKPAF